MIDCVVNSWHMHPARANGAGKTGVMLSPASLVVARPFSLCFPEVCEGADLPWSLTRAGRPRHGLAVCLLGLFAMMLITTVTKAESQPAEPVRFTWIDIFIDSGDQPLAAYQFEATAQTPGVSIVGVEGGEHPAFADAPYYDPKALMNDRIIIAAFSTASDLPAGRTRVARLHLRLTGPAAAEHDLALHAAASPDGNRIPATITMGQGETP